MHQLDAPKSTEIAPRSSTSLTSALGLRLLVATFGLPAAASLFLAAPALMFLFGLGLLEKGGVQLRESDMAPWITPELGLAASALAGVIFLRACWAHRRSPKYRPAFVLKAWLIFGGLLTSGWLVTSTLELAPETGLYPPIHYFFLSGSAIWCAFTLAWGLGRASSRVLVRIEQRMASSGSLRGGIAAAGPSLALGVGGVLAVFLVSDLPEQAIEALEPSKPAAALEGVLSVDDCLTVIYRSEPTRLWDQGVRVARRESAEDPEFVASEAATRVCDKPPRSSELPGKYLSRVASGARDHRRTRSRRAQLLRKCEVPWLDQPATEDRDCVMQVICGMEPDRREVLELFLEGHDDKAMAARLGIGVAAATKRRQRAVDELSKIAREDCR